MRHAESIAERLVHLGGEPTTHPDPIILGKNSKEILKINKKAEEGAIKLYEQIIDEADVQKDDVTKHLFQRILADEEHHFETFSKLINAI
jgi:bacterioferritin